MTRIARVVIPGCPHHIIQRGSRRQNVFFSEDDKQYYLFLLKKLGHEAGIAILGYCLMNNHVHLIAIPQNSDSFAKGIGLVNWKYSLFVNLRNDWSGHLWQTKYLSYPLDETYLYAAMRYVELNPVRAGIVVKAEDYFWSSARAHLLGTKDPLLADSFFFSKPSDWARFLSTAPSNLEVIMMRRHAMTGRPLGNKDFIDRLEKIVGRPLWEKKRGRRPKENRGPKSEEQ